MLKKDLSDHASRHRERKRNPKLNIEYKLYVNQREIYVIKKVKMLAFVGWIDHDRMYLCFLGLS